MEGGRNGCCLFSCFSENVYNCSGWHLVTSQAGSEFHRIPVVLLSVFVWLSRGRQEAKDVIRNRSSASPLSLGSLSLSISPSELLNYRQFSNLACSGHQRIGLNDAQRQLSCILYHGVLKVQLNPFGFERVTLYV